MNKALLKQVRDHILAHPKDFCMATWSCGGVACIAGRVCLLKGYDAYFYCWHPGTGKHVPVPEMAQRLLRLNGAQAGELFYTANWPTYWFNRFSRAPSGAARATMAAAYINSFIRRNG